MRKTTLLVILFAWAVFSIASDDEIRIDDLKKAVATIGKLPFKSPVPVKYFSREKLQAYLQKVFEQDYPNALSKQEEEFLWLMGFVDKPVQLKPLRQKIIMENAGGLYNEKSKELLVIDEFHNIDTINSLLLVHELRHAVLDQYFPLSKILQETSDYDDRKLAVLAAIEGDATLVMMKYFNIDPQLFTSTFQAGSMLSLTTMGISPALQDAPPVIRGQMIMPYIDGLNFSDTILSRKGWKGVNAILKAPPLSSEQVLHPQKFFKNEKPVAVRILYAPPGWLQSNSGTIGEYFLNVLLGKGDNPPDIAAGWGGDLFVVFKNGESWMLLWESAWDSEKDCARFCVDFKNFVERHFAVNLSEGKEKGRAFFAGRSEQGYLFVSKISNRLFYCRSNDRTEMNKFIREGYYD